MVSVRLPEHVGTDQPAVFLPGEVRHILLVLNDSVVHQIADVLPPEFVRPLHGDFLDGNHLLHSFSCMLS